jgi:hypothetical protein
MSYLVLMGEERTDNEMSDGNSAGHVRSMRPTAATL